VRFSNDGKRLLVCGLTAVRVLEVGTKAKTVSILKPTDHFNYAVYSADEKFVFTAEGANRGYRPTDALVRQWDAATGELVREFKGHVGAVDHLAVSPDGKYLASVSLDRTARVWDIGRGRTVYTLPVSEVVGQGSEGGFARGGKELFLTDFARGEFPLWDLVSQTQVRTGTLPPVRCCCGVVMPNGTQAVVGGGEDGTVRLIDLPAADVKHPDGLRPRSLLGGCIAAIANIATLPGDRAVVTSYDGCITLWDLKEGKAVRKYGTLAPHRGPVYGLAVSPDGKTLYTAAHEQAPFDIRMWETDTGKLLGTVKVEDWSIALAVSPDGKHLLFGDTKGRVILWDIETKSEVRRFDGHKSHVRAVAFSPDGETIATGGFDADPTVRIWEVKSGNLLHTREGHAVGVHAIAFSADGKRVVSGGWDKQVRLWDVDSGQHLGTAYHDSGITQVAVGKGGAVVAHSGNPHRVRVSAADLTTELGRFDGHRFGHAMGPVAVTPDGKWAVSGDGRGVVCVWPLPAGGK
jgi:WD40 repeat protein